MKTVVGVFGSREQAERSISELRNKGYERDISLVAKDAAMGDSRSSMTGGDSISDGASTGGVLGGIAGLAIGAGALAIPGIGPIIAAGPIAGLLSGAATGGIAGGLVDWGIPEERGRYYEGKIKEGKIVATVRCDDAKLTDCSETLRKHGAFDVESH